jgi:chaperonin cofactor prefoldin
VLSAHINQVLDKDNIMNFYDEKTKELKQIEIIKNRVNELSKENTKLREQLNNLKTIINYG